MPRTLFCTRHTAYCQQIHNMMDRDMLFIRFVMAFVSMMLLGLVIYFLFGAFNFECRPSTCDLVETKWKGDVVGDMFFARSRLMAAMIRRGFHHHPQPHIAVPTTKHVCFQRLGGHALRRVPSLVANLHPHARRSAALPACFLAFSQRFSFLEDRCLSSCVVSSANFFAAAVRRKATTTQTVDLK